MTRTVGLGGILGVVRESYTLRGRIRTWLISRRQSFEWRCIRPLRRALIHLALTGVEGRARCVPLDLMPKRFLHEWFIASTTWVSSDDWLVRDRTPPDVPVVELALDLVEARGFDSNAAMQLRVQRQKERDQAESLIKAVFAAQQIVEEEQD